MRVELGERSYDIHIGSDWLPELLSMLDFIPRNSGVMIITDANVAKIAGDRLLEIMRSSGFKVELASFPGGEEHKNLTTVRSLTEQMVECGLDRQSTVIALGGGIPGDVAGFAASVYMRGIRYIQVPTTLLAQVDSSVGGKTGVNLPQGKNLVGTFYQPALVFIDVAFIETLPEREYLTGLAEVIKYGIIWDPGFFGFLEQNLTSIKAREPGCLQHIVQRCCAIKADIVAQDETEGGIRALLNLGHTFGHALEALTGYRRYNHGEAVAIGIVLASRLAVDAGILSPHDDDRIKSLIFDLGLPTTYERLDSSDIISQMRKDKKSTEGRLHLVLPIGIGTCQIFTDINESRIAQALY
ncbi:MAG: 3-dehydroquinate synthase [Syntrophomonadaceae bacterium]